MRYEAWGAKVNDAAWHMILRAEFPDMGGLVPEKLGLHGRRFAKAWPDEAIASAAC